MNSANAFSITWNEIPNTMKEWASRHYIVGLQIILVLVIAKLFNRYSGRVFSRLFERAIRPDAYPTKIDRKKRLDTLNELSKAIIHSAVWVVTFLVVLDLLGVDTAPIFASAGLVGAGLAFGAQSVVRDFLSGMFILAENQYRVGDVVDINEVSGTVETIGLRTTVLRDLSGNVYHVPNGSIVVTTNRSMGSGRINMDLSVAADTDVKLLEHVINHAGQRIASNTKFKDDILEPPHFDRISDYTGNAVTVKILGKTIGGKQLQVKSVLLAELKRDFDEHKIVLALQPVLAPPKKR